MKWSLPRCTSTRRGSSWHLHWFVCKHLLMICRQWLPLSVVCSSGVLTDVHNVCCLVLLLWNLCCCVDVQSTHKSNDSPCPRTRGFPLFSSVPPLDAPPWCKTAHHWCLSVAGGPLFLLIGACSIYSIFRWLYSTLDCDGHQSFVASYKKKYFRTTSRDKCSWFFIHWYYKHCRQKQTNYVLILGDEMNYLQLYSN